jgi:glycosyltransferase involved in cell wall biosynthesis
MRIGINALLASAAPSYRNAGVSHYILSLLKALCTFDQTNEYLFLLSEQNIARQLAQAHNVSSSVVGKHTHHPAMRVLWEHLLLARDLRHAGLNLLHAPVNSLPPRLPCPGVVTIHDLAVLRYPHLFRPARRRYQQYSMRQSARRAALVIAISEHTRQDVIELLRVPDERIRVISPILEERFVPPTSEEAIAQFRQRRGLPAQYILFLATLEPRKNLRRLIEAYALLKRETALPHQLVLAGARGWYYQTLEQQVHAAGLQEQIRFAGFVPEEEKPLWYQAADLFVYPSLYEGFGLPVAEAMACGVPVVTSNVSSLPEVVGDNAVYGPQAALTIPPDDTRALARAMQQGLLDFALRQQLRERGLARVQRFAPARIARQLVQAYQDASGRATFD